jgi:hypothetical protein
MKQRRAPHRKWSPQPRRAARDFTEVIAWATAFVKDKRADLVMKQEERDQRRALGLLLMWGETPPEFREHLLAKTLIPQGRAGDLVVDDILCAVAADLKRYGHPVPEALLHYMLVQRRQGLPSGRIISAAQRRRELDSVGARRGTRGPNQAAHKVRDAVVVDLLAELRDIHDIPPTTRGLDIVLQAFKKNDVPLTRRGATSAWKGRS